jgi:hypothetical protein
LAAAKRLIRIIHRWLPFTRIAAGSINPASSMNLVTTLRVVTRFNDRRGIVKGLRVVVGWRFPRLVLEFDRAVPTGRKVTDVRMTCTPAACSYQAGMSRPASVKSTDVRQSSAVRDFGREQRTAGGAARFVAG